MDGKVYKKVWESEVLIPLLRERTVKDIVKQNNENADMGGYGFVGTSRREKKESALLVSTSTSFSGRVVSSLEMLEAVMIHHNQSGMVQEI